MLLIESQANEGVGGDEDIACVSNIGCLFVWEYTLRVILGTTYLELVLLVVDRVELILVLLLQVMLWGREGERRDGERGSGGHGRAWGGYVQALRWNEHGADMCRRYI